ncbi:MAG: glycosyltransferase family 39 protein [Pirellulales bacterium]|nr:glycosyltransferase family 39 protein [Pirellulales bacterium]
MSDRDANKTHSTKPTQDWLGWLLLGVVLLLVIGIRWRTLDAPLERDEGEYAYIASLMLRGVPPYAEAYTMKFPGTPAMYAAAFAMFGESTRGVHLGLLVVNVATMVLMYCLARRWHDGPTSAAAAAVYGLWSLTPGLQGTSAHSEHFAVFFGLAGYAVLAAAVERATYSGVAFAGRVFAGGWLFGVAVLMKQQAAFFVAPALLYLLVEVWRRTESGKPLARALTGTLALALGVFVPFAGLVAALWRWDVLETFWFWAIDYASTYGVGNQTHFRTMLGIAYNQVGKASLLLDALFLLGMASFAWNRESRRGGTLAWCLLAGGSVAVMPGLRFYNHYFLFLLPAASIFAALGLMSLVRLLEAAWTAPFPQMWRAAFLLLVVGGIAWANRLPWFQSSMVGLSRITYGNNPFPEVIEIAKFLRHVSSPGDRLLVFGSEPELYFHAGLPAATKYIYMYPLVERQPYAKQMQAEMIEQVELARPEYCVALYVTPSWVAEAGAPDEIFRWWKNYRHEHYDQIGVADILGRHATHYYLGERWRDYQPQSNVWIGVYRRRDLTPAEPRN